MSISPKLLNPELLRRVDFLVYRYRFLLAYVVIGVGSLLLEFVCFRGLERMRVPLVAANGLGLAAGILFAYWMNVRFNFKIPQAKRNRALTYFVVISAGSATLNFAFKRQLELAGWSYELARIATAGVLFSLAYVLHRRFSFADFKKVGVAIYANGVEDIKGIFAKVGMYPDFIHVDIVDRTFGSVDTDPKAYRLEVVRAYWPSKEIQIHIMSRSPSHWVDEVLPLVDMIILHVEIDEPLKDLLVRIRAAGRKAGLCVMMSTPLEFVQPYLECVDCLMLLTIPEPGRSGQQFDMQALTRVREINSWPNRSGLVLCVDGGVSHENIGLLNVERVVSGSSVLNSLNPARQIMRLQTSSNYERV